MNCPAVRGSQGTFVCFIAPPQGELLYLTIGGYGEYQREEVADLAGRVILAAQSVIKTRETSS